MFSDPAPEVAHALQCSTHAFARFKDRSMADQAPQPTQTNQPKEASAEAAANPASTLKVIRAAILGTVVEYYDFGIYGYMATLLAAHFFVESDPNSALLSTFAAFAVAFFLRAPGGIL